MALETFLSGYRGREARMGAEQTQQLQQMGVLQGILVKAQAVQREQQFQTRLAAAKTPEERVAVAEEFSGAAGILSHADRQLAARNSLESAKARLAATAASHAQDMAHKRAQLDQVVVTEANRDQLARARLALDTWDKNQRGAISAELMRMTGERGTYDYGGAAPAMPNFGPAPTPPSAPAATAPAAAVAPGGEIPAGSIVGSGGMVHRTEIPVPAEDRSLYEGALAGLLRQRGAVVSAPAPMPAPAPAPRNNLDARDLALRNMPQRPAATNVVTDADLTAAAGRAGQPSAVAPAQAAPTTGPTQQQMPSFSGSPREQAVAKNAWLLAKAKAEIKADINIAGGRESVFINRVVMSGNQAAADLANVVQLPMTASRGLFGGRGQDKGIFNAGKETLANAMTTQEVQTYNVVATGFQRALAAIEGAGLAPSNALMNQMDAVIFKEGDTNFTKLMKLAQTRQIVEKGLETITTNTRVDPATKRHAQDIIKKVQTAVPFTGVDLLTLQKRQETNPNATLAEVMGKISGTSDLEERLKKYK